MMKKEVIILSLLCFAFMLPFFLRPAYLTRRHNDLDETVFPIVSVWKQALFETHAFPLLRDDILGGYPFVIDPQPLMYYPPNFLLLFFPFDYTALFLFGLHIFLLGLGTFVWLRYSWRFDRSAALIAGIAVGFTPVVMAHMASGHLNMIQAMALVPWALFLVERVCRTKNLYFLIGFSVVMSLMYSLYASIWYYAMIGVFGYGVWVCFRYRRLLSGLCFFLLFLLLHFSLIAIMLIPEFALRGETTRSSMTIRDIAIPTWSIRRLLMHLVFPVKDEVLATASESMLFFGWSVVLLMFLGWHVLTLRWKVLAILFVVGSLLYMGGERFPLFQLAVKVLPGLAYIRGTTRMLIVVLLFLAPLISLGWVKLDNRIVRRLLTPLLTIELFAVSWWWIFSGALPQYPSVKLGEKVAQIAESDRSRVYCTTYCLSQRQMSEEGVRLLNGNYPVQLVSTVNRIEEAGGYSFDSFSVIHPPYHVYPQKPQPNGTLLADLGVGVVVSPYTLTDSAFDRVDTIDGHDVYRNTRYVVGSADPIIANQISEEAVQWFRIGVVLSLASITVHGVLWIFRENLKKLVT